jgi:hypothetical protein
MCVENTKEEERLEALNREVVIGTKSGAGV